MAILSKDELLEKIKALTADSTADDVLTLYDDIADTIDSLSKNDWQEKYKALDESWRQRYRDRFFNKTETEDNEDETIDMTDTTEIKSYEDLFEERK